MDLVLYRTFLGWFNPDCYHYLRLEPLFDIKFSKYPFMSYLSDSVVHPNPTKTVLKFDLIGSGTKPLMLRIRQDTPIKKENQIFLIYKEIQSGAVGAVAKSYMRMGFLKYEEMRKYFSIYEEVVSHI